MWRAKVFCSSSLLEIGILAEDITTNTAIIWKICRKRNRGGGRFLAVGVALLYISFCQRPSGLPDTLLLHEEESAGGNKLINENTGCRPSGETLVTHIIKCITHTHGTQKGAVFNQS